MPGSLFKNNNATKANSSIQQQTVEQLVRTCQELDLYLNSSPSEPQCFITRKEIAEAHEHSPVFEIAKSLGDPSLIKSNVNAIAKPLLICLRNFVDVYQNNNGNDKVLTQHFMQLLTLLEHAKSYLLKNRDVKLVNTVTEVHQQLTQFARNFPDINLIQTNVRNNTFLEQFFVSSAERQRRSAVEILGQAQKLLDSLATVRPHASFTAQLQP